MLFSQSDLLADTIIKNGVTYTSLVRILAHPETYDGKSVMVMGYCIIRFEHQALYLTKEDALSHNTENSIWIEDNESSIKNNNSIKMKSGFVKIIGTFHFSNNHGSGHLGLWSGSLTDISLFVRSR